MNQTQWLVRRLLISFALLLSVGGCTAPRSVTQSGRVTPRNHFRVGTNYTFNFPTETTLALFDGLTTAIDELAAAETPTYDATVRSTTEAILAYSLDPLGSGMDFYLRYGVYDRFDLGYKFSSGVHVFDARWQFWGIVGEGEDDYRGPSAAVGLQFSMQDYSLPSVLKLDALQDLLGYTAGRKDLLMPITVSHPFGPGEKYGAISYGLAVNLTMLNYGFEPIKMVNDLAEDAIDTEPIAAVHGDESYWSFGGFFNIRGGYKHVFVVASFAFYQQNYGTYAMLEGDEVSFSGWTFVPTLGLEGAF